MILLLYAELIGSVNSSREISVPLRLIIVAMLLMAWAFGRKRPLQKLQVPIIMFLIFSVLYYLRIYIESSNGLYNSHRSAMEFFLYYSSFVFFPCLILSQMKIDDRILRLAYLSVLAGCVTFSVGCAVFYREYIFSGSRLTGYIYENALSPLSLSYVGTLGVGLSLIPLMSKRVRGLRSSYQILAALVCLIPLFLGASRGSVFALSLSLIALVFIEGSARNRRRLLIAMSVFTIVFIALSMYFGEALLTRVLALEGDIATRGSSANRLLIWRAAVAQIADNAVLGSSLEVMGWQFHPHNILLEVLLATGILGFLPFSWFLIATALRAGRIAARMPSGMWLFVIFLQSLVGNMFSGGLYAADWLAISAGLVFACNADALKTAKEIPS